MQFNNSYFKYFLILLFILPYGALISQDYIIKNYDVELSISKDGYFDIHEIIDVEFLKKRRGIQRFIPKKIKHNNATKRIKLENVVVNGDKFSLKSDGNNRIIRIGDKKKYITGSKKYDFSYRVSNALLFEESHTEFLYNVIHDWDVPIQNVTYKIHLPDNLEMPFNDFKVITGKNTEDNRDATIEKEGSIISGHSLKSLKPKENITIAIKLPFDYINKPIPPPPTIPIYEKDKLWAIPLAFLGMFISFFFKSKKEESFDTVRDQPFPPEGFSPAEVGTYYDGTVHTEDIISLLPYWAEKEYISITNNNLEGDENDLYFRKLKPLDSSAPKYQHIVFDGLFEKSSSMVMLSELKNEIYKSQYKASKEIKDNLKQKALYDQGHAKIFKKGGLIALFLVLVTIAALLFIFTSYLITGIITFFAGFVIMGFHFAPHKKSEKGIRVRNHLNGLYNFLNNIDAQKTETLLQKHPNYFEQLFPYAVAFGLDKSWMDKLKDTDINAPTWYGYEGTNTMHHASMHNFSKEFSVPEIKSVFTSAPPSPAGSSSGGGFSGGSAGGGFGGGGSSW